MIGHSKDGGPVIGPKFVGGDMQCSFCGCKVGDDLDNLKISRVIAGPAVAICNVCVDLCREVIDEEEHQAKEAVMAPMREKLQDVFKDLPPGLDAKIAEEAATAKIGDPVEKAERWLRERGIPWEKGAAFRTAYINGRREEPFDEPVTPKPVEPVLDPKAARVVERLEKEIESIRKRGVSIASGYILRDLAVDCGWKEPKPGLEPDELAAICAIARAAPTGDVEAYVEQQRKVLGIWDKASRKVSLGGLGLWSVLGMGALGMMMYDWGKKGDAK